MGPACTSAHVRSVRAEGGLCWQGYMDLNIITVDGMLAPCEFHLLTKDGVFLMEIPRLVTDIVLAVANRCGKPLHSGNMVRVRPAQFCAMFDLHMDVAGLAVQWRE